MADFGTIATRPLKYREDRRSFERLKKRGRRYVLPIGYDVESTIVAETSTLTPTIVGFIGFDTSPTYGKLMPNLLITQAVIDPTLNDADSDAVFVRMLKCMYEGFEDTRSGYLLTRVDAADESTRRLLEAEKWIPTSYREDRSWIPYAWFAKDHFQLRD